MAGRGAGAVRAALAGGGLLDGRLVPPVEHAACRSCRVWLLRGAIGPRRSERRLSVAVEASQRFQAALRPRSPSAPCAGAGWSSAAYLWPRRRRDLARRPPARARRSSRAWMPASSSCACARPAGHAHRAHRGDRAAGARDHQAGGGRGRRRDHARLRRRARAELSDQPDLPVERRAGGRRAAGAAQARRAQSASTSSRNGCASVRGGDAGRAASRSSRATS